MLNRKSGTREEFVLQKLSSNEDLYGLMYYIHKRDHSTSTMNSTFVVLTILVGLLLLAESDLAAFLLGFLIMIVIVVYAVQIIRYNKFVNKFYRMLQD